ncbi:MAG: hypothetical protein ACRC67_28440 [Inquilinus sp.]|uniref:hypothetical protein n=1 Tax=Inquilinus sp. TaxID=1932117 RepID=UPI003F3AA260
MTLGRKASDWNVEHIGSEGTVACPEYMGRFRVDQSGFIRITWATGPAWNAVEIERAAQDACKAAIRPRA